jgi:hypothetical protein
MAKKPTVPAPKKPTPQNKQLVDAIVTVKHLQGFIVQHGGVEKAVAEVAKVAQLIDMTGGVAELTQALEIVGKQDEPTPPAE